MVLGECRSSCLNSYSGAKVEKDVPLALFFYRLFRKKLRPPKKLLFPDIAANGKDLFCFIERSEHIVIDRIVFLIPHEIMNEIRAHRDGSCHSFDIDPLVVYLKVFPTIEACCPVGALGIDQVGKHRLPQYTRQLLLLIAVSAPPLPEIESLHHIRSVPELFLCYLNIKHGRHLA